MVEQAIQAGKAIGIGLTERIHANRWRVALLLGLIALFVTGPEMREVMRSAMSDAFIQVTVFVAGTLALVFWFEHKFAFNLGALMRENLRWQPLIASALGAIPGCGGAIIVVTQFTKGYASFGAFISVLVATMGDAAILLVARDPKSAFIVISISLVAGVVTGMIVDAIHGRDFMAVAPAASDADIERFMHEADSRPPLSSLWISMVAIGVPLGLLVAFQYDIDAWFGSLAEYSPLTWFGFLGACLCVVMWAMSRNPHGASLGVDTAPGDSISTRVIKDTNFVTTWVILAFLAYEVSANFLGLDVKAMFANVALLVPLIAVLVGFIPGCGPQVVVTSLYLAGAIPLSAQMANAIANDGDALFPALALAPKAAILATIYSAVPALLIGYGWFFLFDF